MVDQFIHKKQGVKYAMDWDVSVVRNAVDFKNDGN